MEVTDAIKKRRSIRDYKEQEVPKEKIEKLIEAARWAPSGSNIQPWRIKVVKGEKLNAIKKFSPGLLSKPPVILVMCADKKEAENKGGKLGRDVLSVMDIAIASQNICIQATDMELGTCYIGSFNKDAVRKLLNIPEHIVPELMLTVGVPKHEPKPPSKKDFKEIVEWVGWDNE